MAWQKTISDQIKLKFGGPHPVSNLSQTFRFPAPEGKEGLERHGLNVSRLTSLYVAWLRLTHKTEMLGEAVLGIAWCCQPHWMGNGQHPNLKMDMMNDGVLGVEVIIENNTMQLQQNFAENIFKYIFC